MHRSLLYYIYIALLGHTNTHTHTHMFGRSVCVYWFRVDSIQPIPSSFNWFLINATGCLKSTRFFSFVKYFLSYIVYRANKVYTFDFIVCIVCVVCVCVLYLLAALHGGSNMDNL